MNNKIMKFLIDTGVSPSSVGFIYLRDAIGMTIQNKCVIPCMEKDVYPKLSKTYGTTRGSIERAMRFAIEQCTKKEYRNLPNKKFIAKAAIMLSMEEK